MGFLIVCLLAAHGGHLGSILLHVFWLQWEAWRDCLHEHNPFQKTQDTWHDRSACSRLYTRRILVGILEHEWEPYGSCIRDMVLLVLMLRVQTC